MPIVLLMMLASCQSNGDKKSNSGSEIELFARAQELQKQEKFNEAVNIYRNIAKKFANTRQGANSQFMIGYIYANHIKDLKQATLELNRFLEDFSSVSDSGLIEGAKFELLNLGKDINDIPILSGLGETQDTSLVQESAKEQNK